MVSVARLLIACALAAGAPQPPETSDASVARVRAALEKPPPKLTPLTLTERKPDFTVIIRERARFERLLPPILDFRVGPGFPPQALFTSPYGSRPLYSVDLLSMGMAAAAGINEVRKAHARRSALEEVRRTIAEYCAAQPLGGAGIQICSK